MKAGDVAVPRQQGLQRVQAALYLQRQIDAAGSEGIARPCQRQIVAHATQVRQLITEIGDGTRTQASRVSAVGQAVSQLEHSALSKVRRALAPLYRELKNQP